MTSRTTVLAIAALSATLTVATSAAPQRNAQLSARAFLSPSSPLEITAAKKVDRVAWVAYEEGKRNVYTAAAPAFVPVRLTAYLEDDGVDLTGVEISADGSTVVFVREYQWLVDERASEAVWIRRQPCRGGIPIMGEMYVCPPIDGG